MNFSLSQMIIFAIIFLAVIWLLTRIVLHNRYKKIERQIKDAPNLASSMQPGQKVVKTLFTLNDDQISRFLAAFPTDEFSTSIKTRRIRQNNSSYNSYSTVIIITKKPGAKA